jgi:Icc-related predicted phosphoesterase
MRVAAVADIHLNVADRAENSRAFAAVNDRADVLVIAGDLTNHGKPEEMRGVLDVLSGVTIPIVAVLGNHDYESGQEGKVCEMILDAGIHLLDGGCFELDGIGFAGVKGSSGGFTPHELMPFGERYIKDFVDVAIKEAASLDRAIARLKAPKRIAITHYAPIKGTVAGEPEPIFPFLGSSRLEVVLDRRRPEFALHGHAHHGSFSGATTGGVPVFNVALHILKKRKEPFPFVVFDV